MKILVVDDSTINNILLQNLLEENGFEVISALNGYDALEILNKNKIGIILLDIMMPKFSGFDFLKQLMVRKIKVPVIAISANSDYEYKKKSLEMGAKDFITKPIQLNSLIRKIKEIMALA